MTNDQRIYQLVAEHLGIDSVNVHKEQLLVRDLDMDSLDHVEIVMALEDEFNIEIDDDVAGTLLTVGNLITYVDKVAK